MSFLSALSGYTSKRDKALQPVLPPPPAPEHPLSAPLREARVARMQGEWPFALPELVSSERNLGVLVMIIDGLPNEVLWRLWEEQLQQEGAVEGAVEAQDTMGAVGAEVEAGAEAGAQQDAEVETGMQQVTKVQQQGTQETHEVQDVQETKTKHPHPQSQPRPQSRPQPRPRIRFWFHAKFPDKVRSVWVRERLVRGFHFRPDWGSVEIAKVMVCMLAEATSTAPWVNKFVFASESCLPLLSAQQLLDAAYAPASHAQDTLDVGAGDTDYHSSWLHHSDQPTSGYAKQLQFDVLERRLPKGCVHKASQWVLVSRAHALDVVRLLHRVGGAGAGVAGARAEGVPTSTSISMVPVSPTPPTPPPLRLLLAFNKTNASDEMFFPCCLALLGHINPGIDMGVGLGNGGGGDGVGTGSTSNGTSRGSIDTGVGNTTTTAITTFTTAATAAVVRRQLTHADWSNNGKSPETYTVFPVQVAMGAALATPPLLRLLPLVSTPVAAAAAAVSTKAALTGAPAALSTISDGSTVPRTRTHAQPSEQAPVFFLRKIKFPGGERPLQAGVGGEGGLTHQQRVFLLSWLLFLLGGQERAGTSTGAGAGTGAAIEAGTGAGISAMAEKGIVLGLGPGAALLEQWLLRAAGLMHAMLLSDRQMRELCEQEQGQQNGGGQGEGKKQQWHGQKQQGQQGQQGRGSQGQGQGQRVGTGYGDYRSNTSQKRSRDDRDSRDSRDGRDSRAGRDGRDRQGREEREDRGEMAGRGTGEKGFRNGTRD